MVRGQSSSYEADEDESTIPLHSHSLRLEQDLPCLLPTLWSLPLVTRSYPLRFYL